MCYNQINAALLNKNKNIWTVMCIYVEQFISVNIILYLFKNKIQKQNY